MTTQEQNPATVETETENLSTTEQTNSSEAGEETTFSHLEAIETVISSLEDENTAMVRRIPSGHLWKFCYGSVEVFVLLTGESDDDTLKVWSPILNLPAKNEPQLMRKLMEMNWTETFETCFAVLDNQVVVVAHRTVADLSPGEISRAITLVATIADDNDEALQAEFGQGEPAS